MGCILSGGECAYCRIWWLQHQNSITASRFGIRIKAVEVLAASLLHDKLTCHSCDGCLRPATNVRLQPAGVSAGIELRGRDRKTRGIDYNAEVAFEKKPVPGFYDTGDEVRHTKEMQQEFRPTTVEEMEGKRRKVGDRYGRRAMVPEGLISACIAPTHMLVFTAAADHLCCPSVKLVG